MILFKKNKIVILSLLFLVHLICFALPAKAANRIPDASCLQGSFHLTAGGRPETDKVDMFNFGDVPVNSYSVDAWQKVSDELTGSSNEEVKGILKYMEDYHAGKVLSFKGTRGGSSADGTVSYSIGKAGVNRHTKEIEPLYYDMHVSGLALDFMTESNWDIYVPGKAGAYVPAKAKTVQEYCKLYASNFAKIKKQFPDDPYHMYKRIEEKLGTCLTFGDGKDPWTIFPDDFINIFKKNGFQWGGDVFNHYRSDGMHFQYVGTCASTDYANNRY